MSEKKYIVFTLNGERYGVPVEQVLSIEKPEGVTPVPNTAPFVKGIMNLRGILYPVIDMKQRFGIGESAVQKETRLAIVQIDDIKVAILIDSAEDVISIDEESIEPAPEVTGGVKADYIHGVAKIDDGLLVLLNLDRVLRDKDVEIVKKIEVNER